MFAIVVNEKGGEQKRLEFDKPEVTIGRVQGNDIILPKGNVSKRHSRIVLKDGKFIIVDLKSTNGTYVNGRKITSPLVVKGTDKIYIGDFILSIEELNAGAGDEPVVPPPPPRKQPTIPPPPPRRVSQPSLEADGEEADEAAPPDEAPREEAPPVEPVSARAPRSSSPSLAPAGLPPAPAPAAARVTGGYGSPAPLGARPPSRSDLPAHPASATRSSMSRSLSSPSLTPAPLGARSAPAARPAPQRERRPAATLPPDDGRRAKITEVMRELSTRLQASLGIQAEGDTTAEEDLWGRAEAVAGDLLDEISSNGALPPGVDTSQLLKDVVAETVGIGPLEELLADESVREIAVPRHDRVFVDRGGVLQAHAKWFASPDSLTRAVERLMARSGRPGELQRAQANGGLVEARIDGGLLLTCALPPLAARGPSLTIRRPRREVQRLGDLVGEGMLSQGMADFLEFAVRGRRNLVVSGPAASGRSTLLQALARAAEGERLVSVEEAEELELGEGPWVSLVGHGAQKRHALAAALRLRPDRLVLGDLRGAETLDMLGAVAGGADGAMCAVQAGSPRDALQRLVALARLAPEAPPLEALQEAVGRGVSVVVQLARAGDGELRVSEIADVSPGGQGPQVQTVFSYRPDAAGGRFSASGHVPAWADGAPHSMFR